MQKILVTLSAAAAALTFVSSASAQDRYYDNRTNNPAPYAAPLVGAAAGTAVGLGLYNGWWANAAWPTTALGSAAAGFVVGAGTLAVVHAATTPCQGFHFLFGAFTNSANECVNGRWVGPGARVQQTAVYEEQPVVTRRTVRRHR